MEIPISHTTIEKLIATLEACYKECFIWHDDMWADFNLVAITRDLIEGDCHRVGETIEITPDTAEWLEVISADSDEEDLQLIAASLEFNARTGMLD